MKVKVLKFKLSYEQLDDIERAIEKWKYIQKARIRIVNIHHSMVSCVDGDYVILVTILYEIH